MEIVTQRMGGHSTADDPTRYREPELLEPPVPPPPLAMPEPVLPELVLPQDRSAGIGCVGAGFIMADCHLVAYRAAGFNPVAIASHDPKKARAVAAR